MGESILMLAASPSPAPFDPNTVTPGVAGFFAIFFVAALTVLIVFDLMRRVRRVRYREEVRDQIAAERAAEGGASREEHRED